MIACMTLAEARHVIVEAINYAAYKETDSSLYDSDKNRLFGSEHYNSGRDVVKPSPWTEGDFEEKMAMLLGLASALNRSAPALTEARNLLEGEDSVIGRVIRQAKMNSPTLGTRKSPWRQPGVIAVIAVLVSINLVVDRRLFRPTNWAFFIGVEAIVLGGIIAFATRKRRP